MLKITFFVAFVFNLIPLNEKVIISLSGDPSIVLGRSDDAAVFEKTTKKNFFDITRGLPRLYMINGLYLIEVEGLYLYVDMLRNKLLAGDLDMDKPGFFFDIINEENGSSIRINEDCLTLKRSMQQGFMFDVYLMPCRKSIFQTFRISRTILKTD